MRLAPPPQAVRLAPPPNQEEQPGKEGRKEKK